LSDLYPGSESVRESGLRGASDLEVWQYARENGLVIVSKDSDFSQRSLVVGHPPKVIWLRLGNCTTARIEFVLRNTAGRVRAFENDAEDCLVLAYPRGRGAS
jgi:predicted nuclease of predicted toxin-antitoxin system